MNFLHTFTPNPILINIGPLTIYWYGLFIVSGILAATLITLRLAGRAGVKKDTMVDLIFWAIIAGMVGARLYHVILELPYYLANPLDVFKVWQGGLAIHGAIIGGLLTVWLMSRKRSLDFWLLTALTVPGLALAQAIGRWGNYFNQELFGRPTDQPWGIPIALPHRPFVYLNADYFQPAFLYESAGNLLIFVVLILGYRFLQNTKAKNPAIYDLRYRIMTLGYLFLYSTLRFIMEFIRIDPAYSYFGLRLPQYVCLLTMLGVIIYFAIIYRLNKNKPAALAKE